LPGSDSDNLPVLDNKIEAAARTAIRTRGWYIVYVHSHTSIQLKILISPH